MYNEKFTCVCDFHRWIKKKGIISVFKQSISRVQLLFFNNFCKASPTFRELFFFMFGFYRIWIWKMIGVVRYIPQLRIKLRVWYQVGSIIISYAHILIFILWEIPNFLMVQSIFTICPLLFLQSLFCVTTINLSEIYKNKLF